MKYNACIQGPGVSPEPLETEITIQREGLSAGSRFLDFADLAFLRPMNHRVFLDLLGGGTVEISMLGFSYDGFWEELILSFGNRSKEALFIEEDLVMQCEGEYALPADADGREESGRCLIALYPDAVCIMPQTSHAVRIPLCYTEEIVSEGYQLFLRMHSGAVYRVGKMGYDTEAFVERCMANAEKTKKKRKALLSGIALTEPFTRKGLFRTEDEKSFWQAGFGKGCCAVELFTDEKTATYLYRFQEEEIFVRNLEEAMEAVGTHREIIFMEEEELLKNPVYRMCVHRCPAVRFLRESSAGRIIHSASHGQKLTEFLST